MVDGKDVYESVIFTQQTKKITINLTCAQAGGYYYYNLTASEPVTTPITVSITVHYLEEDVCQGKVVYENDEYVTATISPGQTSASASLANGGDACTTISLNVKGAPSTPWDGQTINGATYSASGTWF